jgi:hypothetical protein
MAARTWRWLRTRIEGLLSADTRTWRHFHGLRPKPGEEEASK